MKSYINLFLLILTFNSINAQELSAFFTLTPTLSPEADYIVFSYEGDLWKVATNGGDALRLTAMHGDESHPSISPDGQWLAFSSNQYGNTDVYVMPINGGDIQQLTFNEANDIVTSWSWDSKTIYFTSDRYNSVTTYTVNLLGGTPRRLFDHYFNTIHNVVVHPITNAIFFNESWESGRFAHRKRYKGDFNPDIKSYQPSNKEYTKHTSYRGKDFGVTIDQQGNIYFISDRDNDQYNLYKLTNGNVKALTSFDTSIMWPKVSANGTKIVFRKDYQLYVYDVSSGKVNKPNIKIIRNSTLQKASSFSTTGKISQFDVSPDEKKLAFISRGKLFISDVKGKFIKEIPTLDSEAIKEVKWLNDNKTLLYSRSHQGYYNWFTIAADDSAQEHQLTKEPMNHRQLSLNKDRSKGVFLKGRNEVCLLDLKSFRIKSLITDELWGFYNTTPHFSPDDRYIVYNAYRNFETDIFVYDTENGKTFNLTNTKVSESSPFWSLDGKYLFFSSDRENPGYPYGTKNSKIYRMALDTYQAPFKIDKVQELFQEEEKKDDTSKKKAKNNEHKEGEDKIKVQINPISAMDRLERISPRFGQQFGPIVVRDKDKTHIIYVSDHSEGDRQLWKTTLEPFEKNKTERISDKKVNEYQLVTTEKNNYLLIDGILNKLQLDSNKLEKIDIDFTFEKSFKNEFQQMFYEAWSGFEENFYDGNFHGQNWQKLRDHYAQYLPYITSRAQLRLLFNELLGELNTSHFGFYSNGQEEKIFYGSRSLATGILFSNEQPYIVERIVKESPADTKDVLLVRGDKLVAVNGMTIDQKMNRESYFAVPKFTDELSMTFERDGHQFTTLIHPTSVTNIRNLLYDEWQDANQDYVDTKSNNKIAYVHMKNMGSGELMKFKEDLVSTIESDKEALILDLRYNTGGNVHDDVLQFLSQRTYLNWKYRDGKLTGQSNFGYGDKPLVLLINEQSLSDAEMTAQGFKQLGLGTIVGTETYRWIIFTTGKSLVDGSFYRLPSWGCYTLDGKNLEKEGVSPDVHVGKNFEDRLENKHPQLDKAIEILLGKVKK